MNIVIKLILVAIASAFPKFKMGYGVFLIILMTFVSLFAFSATFLLNKLSDAIHLGLVSPDLVKNHLRWVQALLLPFQAALNGPVKNARKFRGKFNTKFFVLLFSTKCTVERDRLDTAPILRGITIDFSKPESIVAPAAMTAEGCCSASTNAEGRTIDYVKFAIFEVVIVVCVSRSIFGTQTPLGVSGIERLSSW